jgi:hypothetical protein
MNTHMVDNVQHHRYKKQGLKAAGMVFEYILRGLKLTLNPDDLSVP